LGIFLLGLVFRIFSVWPNNTIVGFDQVRDFFSVQKILQGDWLIIGPTAGNNPSLHHGIAYIYYLLLPLFLGHGNPMWAVYWNCLFNAFSIFTIYLLGKEMFSKKTGLISAFLFAIAYQLIQYSGWLSNPTVTVTTVPLFFLFLWRYIKNTKHELYLPLVLFFLGLSIQFELFFLYLIPIPILIWVISRPKWPTVKTLFLSTSALLISLSTMVLTEIKFGFAGVKSVLRAGQMVGGGKTDYLSFINRYFETFSHNLTPTLPHIGISIGIITFVIILISFVQQKRQRRALVFLLIYLLSPALMLLLGYHYSPWFLVGLSPATILAVSFVIGKIKPKIIPVIALALVFYFNFKALQNQSGQPFFEPDRSAILSTQLKAIDYTYQASGKNSFAMNSVTNPLYINAIWAYHYKWYGGKKYGFLPGWLGGNQLYPYNTLPDATGQEKFIYLITDQTPRIPPIYKNEVINSAQKIGRLVEENNFEGLTVLKYQATQ